MKPWQEQGEPYIYGYTSSDDTDGSYVYYERPDTPVPDTPEQAERKAATMWGNAKVDKKPRWGPPTSVSGNDDYCSSVLKKDGYL